MRKKNSHQIIIVILLTLLYVGLSCPPNCLFCLKQNKCLTCQQQYFLTVNSQCVSKSVQNCQVYSQTGKCSICASTFVIDNKSNQCLKDFSGCLKRDQKGICIECGFGTTLNIKGECLGVINCARPQRNCNTCLNGYKLENNKCVYAGTQCQVIHSSGLCQQCKDGYILNGFECVSKASSSVQNGNLNLIQKCSLYSRNEKTCLACENGYKLFNNGCTSQGEIYKSTISLADSKIRQASNNVFVDTKSEFITYSTVLYSLSGSKKDDYLDPKQREISSLTFQGVGTSPSAKDNCLVRDSVTLACKVCIDGYYYFNGLCKQKSIVCQKFNTTTNKCEKCGNNFVLINGQCLDAGCQEYLYAQCAKCKSGFQINEQGYCYDPFCSSKTDGQCTKCLAGYQLDQSSQLCYKVILGCQLYNQQKSLCQLCSQGYEITPQGVCTRAEDERCLIYSKTNFQECVRCRDEFALMQGTCIDLYCRVFETPRNCKLCRQGYILHPTKFYCFDKNCVLYSNGTCINCANNYKLQQGFCAKVLQGCKRVQPATQKCLSCMQSYRLADGKCMQPENDRCIKTVSGLCVQCRMEFALINGTCVDTFCEKETLFNNFYACTQCKAGFNLNLQGVCSDDNCLRPLNGSCTKCNDDYVVGSTGLCVKSTLGCAKWLSQQNRCQQCTQGYQLKPTGVCALLSSTSNNNQSTNTTTIIGNNETKVVIINPSKTDPTDLLTPPNKPSDSFCRQFAKDSVTCIRCIDGRYFIRNSRCEAVPQICKGFDMKSGNCTSCETGYAVYTEKSAHQDCFKKIQSPDPNCSLRNLNSFCIKCRPQFFIKAGFCYQADTQCKTFDLYGGDCLTCYEGFTLQNKKCIPLTQQSKCKKYDFQNVCVECEKGYFVAQGGICTQVLPTCSSYEMIGGACLTCAIGYWPSNGVCVKVRDPTTNCMKTNQLGNCVECLNRFFIDSSGIACKPVNKLCNQYNMLTGACLSCNSGFKLRPDLGLCVTQTSDDFCTQFNQQTGICTKCQADYVLATSTSKCVKQLQLCSTYNQQSGQCEKCQQPYVLSFKECIQKTKRDTLDSNCLLGDTYNYCIKCKTGYYISTGYCFKANTLCKTFNPNTGACESCYDGFVVKNKLCVDLGSSNNNNQQNTTIVNIDENCLSRSGSLCLKCKDRYYLSYEAQLPTCKKVSDSCLTYNQINGYCLTCITGYNMSTSGNCIGTPSNSTIIQNPTTYIDLPQIFCKQFDLTLKVCHTCYNSYYYSANQGTCKPLNLSCKTQEPVTKRCTSCHEGGMLNVTKCVPAPQAIKYWEDILKYENAALLNDDVNCVALSDKKCIQCQAGYYVDNSTNKCLVLSQWCDVYEMLGGKCNKCKLGAIMQDGLCVKPVLGIDPYCSKYNGAFCVECMEGYKLDNYVCKKS